MYAYPRPCVLSTELRENGGKGATTCVPLPAHTAGPIFTISETGSGVYISTHTHFVWHRSEIDIFIFVPIYISYTSEELELPLCDCRRSGRYNKQISC